MPRKMRCIRCVSTRSLVCFNEAGAEMPRKIKQTANPAQMTTSFNEAGAEMPRKIR